MCNLFSNYLPRFFVAPAKSLAAGAGGKTPKKRSLIWNFFELTDHIEDGRETAKLVHFFTI